uniref:WD repeat domain 35 family protein n=1 Tax=Toxoplasma gondii COUG TaxID=1074873 RepID=A0A2G8Y8K1_TOXGO|nr:WD repeat domain 35 family protein [Toxoplasma gondii COUG]
MLAFFVKKVTPAAGAEIVSLSWQNYSGYLALGFRDGMLKVLDAAHIAESVPKDAPKAEDGGGSRSRIESTINHIQTLSSGKDAEAKHAADVHLVAWNEKENSLTSADQAGCVAIWKAEGSQWVNELTNIDTSKKVVHVAWAPDGKKICILAADGNLVLGTADGKRLWSKDLKRAMTRAAWSPDGRKILLCSMTGEIVFYDNEGLYSHRLRTQLADNPEDRAEPLLPVAGIHWRRVTSQQNSGEAEAPTLAIAYENGLVQLFRSDADESPLTFDACLHRCLSIQWHPTHPILAVFGESRLLHPDARDCRLSQPTTPHSCMIRFYSVEQKRHLYTLVVPKHGAGSAFSWDAHGERLAVASKGAVLFATFRMKTPAAYFAQTLIYTQTGILSRQQALSLWFWNVDTNSKHLRSLRAPVRHLLGSTQCCVVITDAHEEDGTTEAVANSRPGGNSAADPPKNDVGKQYAISLYNSIAEPMKTTYTEVEPEFAAVTDDHVLVADSRRVFLWKFAASRADRADGATHKVSVDSSKPQIGTTSNIGSAAASCSIMALLEESEGSRCLGRRETIVEVETVLSQEATEDTKHATAIRNCVGRQSRWGRGDNPAGNPIVALAAINGCFVVARRNGELRRYSLPFAQLEATCNTETLPLSISLNCDATRLAIVDIFNNFGLRNASVSSPHLSKEETTETTESGHRNAERSSFGAPLNFTRQDVCDVLWSRDEADHFAMMEKSTIYLVRGTTLEEPLRRSASFLGDLHQLRLELFDLDELQKTSAEPNARLHRLQYETKRLRDTRDILEKARELDDAITYAENASHPSLWKLIAQNALEQMKLEIAEKAFVNCQDYWGLQFIKRIRALNEEQREAEVRAYFGDFDRAESLYLATNRRDLALSLRSAVGDWRRVIELGRAPPDSDLVCTSVLQRATKALGDSCREQGQWREAIEAYRSIRDHRALAQAYYNTEQFDELENLVGDLLPETDRELLLEIGEKFASVGLCPAAVRAFMKAGDTQAAIDCCIRLNEWDTAVTLAEQGRFHQIEPLLTKCAGHLLEQNKHMQAVQLYQRAGKPLEAAKILMQLAALGEGYAHQPGIQSPQYKPERKKKLYVLAALEAEKITDKTLQGVLQVQSPARRTSRGPSPSSDVLRNSGMSDSEATGAEKNAGGVEKDKRFCDARLVVETGTSAATSELQSQTYACHMTQVHKQLINGAYDAAVCTAVQLTEYSDFIDGLTAFSVLALASFYARNWELCSKAFMFLENSGDVPTEQREAFAELAVEIFSRHPPAHENENPPLCTLVVPYTRLIQQLVELLTTLVEQRHSVSRLSKNCYHAAHVVTECLL